MMTTTTAKQLATELCEQFPNAPTKTLARRLYEENRERFPNLESARSAIRTVRGNNGEKKRRVASAPRKPQSAGWKPACPPSAAEPWTPVDLGGRNCILSLSDIHIPYHDRNALTAAVRFAKRRHKPTVLLLNGDYGDFYAISRFDRDPKRRDLRAEIDTQRQGLRWLRAEFPNVRFVFKCGNHEDRWDKFIWNKAVELWNLDAVQLHNVLHFDELGIELVNDQPVMAGELPILHGHEIGKGIFSPVNPARGAFLRTNHTVLIGHLHRSSTHAETNMWHSATMAWSQGCLCDMTPEYARVNRWNQGFCVVEVAQDGAFNLHNYRLSREYEVRTA